MERNEPTLVPEWLRNSASITGGGSSAHHFAASSSHSDIPSISRNRTSKSIGDFDASHPAFLDRTSSLNSRRNFSNGSAKHAYSSFNRGHRDKDREKEKQRSNFGDHWDHDCSDPVGNIFSSRIEKDTLRRIHSMVSKKQGELLLRRGVTDLKCSTNTNHINGNVVPSGTSIANSIRKAVFDKDFPLLGSEEKQGVPDIGRVSSPGLCTAVQSLPVGSLYLIGGEGWTSALAEVPTVIGGNCRGSSSVQQTVASTSWSGPPSVTTGLNMAEALAQVPSRARTTSQITELSVTTQRLEELAIKQSRQLIPVTPSMPKASVLNNSDKSKPKTPSWTGELNVTAKSRQQPSVHHPNQSLRGGNVKSDAPKTSDGKFLVLKPVWENGVSPTPKDGSSPTHSANNGAANAQPAVAPATLRSPNNINPSSLERRVAAIDLKSGPTLEKRPSFSQVQSRNDFFNLIKKKTLMSTSAVFPDSGPVMSSPTVEKSSNQISSGEAVSAPASSHVSENGTEVISNGDSSEDIQRFADDCEKRVGLKVAVYPDEEEATFLRSLGWEENSGEDEGLTEEEINAFYQEYMKLKPTLKLCRGMQAKLSIPSESHGANLCGAGSELCATNLGSEA